MSEDRLAGWLATGAHASLNVERHPSPSIGRMTGGGHKGVIHITVSPWSAIDSMIGVLRVKSAEPQTVIGGRSGFTFPVLAQLLDLRDSGKALRHPSGTSETNRANAQQMEICARPGNLRLTRTEREADYTPLFDLPDVELPDEVLNAAAKAENGSESHAKAAIEMIHLCMEEDDELLRAYQSGVGAWTDDTYKALGNAWHLIDQQWNVPAKLARSFNNTTRFSGPGWIKAEGFLGHMHCPFNDHVDPTTAFWGRKLVRFLKSAPNRL
jgi:hypothetical protein